ncbi:MAG: hypothetical protein JW809_11280 [Pirellulales bacterium]|nr:hypothetical protein [Pirellulales bacterium]
MNSIPRDNLSRDDDRLFDLLADDELDEERRGRLLGGLDDRPGGWRRCALAFLEAQSWKKEIGALGRKPESLVPATETAAAASRRRRRLGRGSAILGMAASLLLGIGLTSLVRDLERGGMLGPGGGGFGQQAGLMGGGGGSAAGVPGALGIVRLAPGGGGGAGQVGVLTRGPDGTIQMVALPVIDRQQLDEDWVRGLPVAIPPEVSRALEQSGHEVRSSRQLVPIAMPDGRRVVFPVDQLDVRYVGNGMYQ